MVKRLLEYNLERLKNKRMEARLEAINELRLLGDPTALEALENVYRNDSEPEVRKAAQLAGREIFMKQRENQA